VSAECDAHPREALDKLTAILGPPTFVVRSGGEWLNETTGEYEPKLHLHWVLAAPTKDAAGHAKLKRARELACAIVAGDPTSTPIVHPMRLPGSWHRKKDPPRLCRIETHNSGIEIELDVALTKLEAACPKSKTNGSSKSSGAGEGSDWLTDMQEILSAKSYHAALTRLAAKVLKAGMKGGAAVNFLRGLMNTSAGPHDERWQARYDDIPRAVSSAEKKGFKPEPENDGDPFASYAKAQQPGEGEEQAPGQATPEQEGDPEEALLAKLNRDYCVVRDGGKTRVLYFERHELHINEKFTHTRHVPMTNSFEDFRNFHLNQTIVVQEGKTSKEVTVGKWWLRHPGRRTYPGLVFVPDGAGVINGRLNLWRGWGVEPKAGDWSLMQRHMLEVLAAGNKALFEYIQNWLAWSVQHPAERATVALAFRGKRGTGRSTLGNAMVHIFGQHGGHVSSARHVTGNFNAHMRDCCFLFADEAFWPGDKAAEGALKRLITEPDLAIEMKHRDIVYVPNMLHVMFASNDEWIIPAGEGERRFAGFDVPDRHMQDEKWFGPLYEQMEGGGYGAMLYDLLRHPLGDFHPRRFPRTDMLLDQQARSLKPEDTWWVELLETGVLYGNTRARPDLAASNEFEVEVETMDAYGNRRTRLRKIKGLYDQAREISPRLRNTSDHTLGNFLAGMGCSNDNHCGPKRTKRGWKFPDLDSARTKWEERFPSWKWRNASLDDWEASEDI
jgi:hypothetical protein